MSTPENRQVPAPSSPAIRPNWRRILVVAETVGLIGIVLFACTGTSIQEFFRVLGIGVLLSGAFFAVGALVGFLFGIPRTLQEQRQVEAHSRSRDTIAPDYRPNTNLEEISDWLTKILVGVGLTQLAKTPASIRDAASYLATGLGLPQDQVFVLSLMGYFTIVGFLSGYFVTRMYLGPAFSRADMEVLRSCLQVGRELQDLDKPYRQEVETPEEGTQAYTEPPPATPEQKRRIAKLDQQMKLLELQGAGFDAEAYAKLARQLRRAGRYEEAVDAYLRAYKLDPNSVTYLNSAGVVRSKDLQDHTGAEELYKSILVSKPDYTPALYNMACNETRREHYDSALEYLKQAIRSNPVKYIPMAKRDPVLEPLRGRADFGELVDGEPSP